MTKLPSIMRYAQTEQGLADNELRQVLEQSLANWPKLDRVLIIPPDYTRLHSGAGRLTAMFYDLLKDKSKVDLLPALGTHEPMSEAEYTAFFGPDVPYSAMIVHNWRTDVVKIGEIPAAMVKEESEGLMTDAIDVEINKHLLDPAYDLIISVGQVVPHEVVGMANYSKNILVGCGGNRMINGSHMLGAFYGMERIMGRDKTPVRAVLDYAEENFLNKLPLMYVLTVTTAQQDDVSIHAIFTGREREIFAEAVKLSQAKNLIFLDEALDKVVVYLDEREFKSTWLGNKAVYRTRMALAPGASLIILAPGVRRFGEDDENDRLIRKYGYVGRKNVVKLIDDNKDLQDNLSVAAHLIHGSSDDQFEITYAVSQLTEAEIKQVNFNYLPYKEAIKLYDPATLKDGFNTLDSGERIFYISNPALGLWADRKRF